MADEPVTQVARKRYSADAARLATIHNVYFFNNLMAQIRNSIRSGTFQKLKKDLLFLLGVA